MARIVADLKRGKNINTQTLSAYFKEHEGEPGAPLGCSPRTVARDIQVLQQEHNAPILYDDSSRGYVLTDPNWRFTCPVFDEDFVNMSMLGVQLAEAITPEPLKQEMDNALMQTLTNNASEFFDEAMMDTLLCASGVKSPIAPEVFKTLFDGWRRKQCLALDYKDPGGKKSAFEFEPHMLVFHKGNWYAKGYLRGTKEVRIFACQRMVSVRPLPRSFQMDRRLLEDTKRNGFFNYPKVSGIKLRCDASIAFYIHEQQKVFQSKLTEEPDGALVLELKPTVEHEVIRWILGEGGSIEVLEPKSLREKIAEAGREIARRNS
ncbi:MAG: WYL domain-containing protein [Victivallales bacterium]|nr:WYL domain-containing protein [Victivallales bacterium]